MDFFTERYPVARKYHKCDICGGTIKVGERYCRESGNDGVFFDRCVCKSCYSIRHDVYEKPGVGDYEYCDWEMSDYVHEEYCCKKCTECAFDRCEYKPLVCEKVKDCFSKQVTFW